MPLPAAHFRPVQSAVKTANAKVWGVAALPAQPLAALPLYGCGVPLAGSDRLVQSHSTAGGHWCTSRSPDVSLRGAKRRGNLAVPGRIVGKLSAKTQLPSRDCHVGLWPPRNDKLGSLTHLPEIPPDLQLPKAVTDRRYRRNWCIPFSRWPVQIGSASPRLHPEGTSSRFALRAPRRPLASSQ